MGGRPTSAFHLVRATRNLIAWPFRSRVGRFLHSDVQSSARVLVDLVGDGHSSGVPQIKCSAHATCPPRACPIRRLRCQTPLEIGVMYGEVVKKLLPVCPPPPAPLSVGDFINALSHPISSIRDTQPQPHLPSFPLSLLALSLPPNLLGWVRPRRNMLIRFLFFFLRAFCFEPASSALDCQITKK